MNAKSLTRFAAVVALAVCTCALAQQGKPAQADGSGMDALRAELRRDPHALYERTLSLSEREPRRSGRCMNATSVISSRSPGVTIAPSWTTSNPKTG